MQYSKRVVYVPAEAAINKAYHKQLSFVTPPDYFNRTYARVHNFKENPSFVPRGSERSGPVKAFVLTKQLFLSLARLKRPYNSVTRTRDKEDVDTFHQFKEITWQ